MDELELDSADVGRNTIWALWDVRAPRNQFPLGRESDDGKKVFLAPSPPAPSDKRAGAEAGMWEVVDDFVDELLGE